MRRLLARACGSLALLLLLQESVARLVFPLPAVLDFDRGDYSPLAALPASDAPDSLGHLSFSWTSDPDGFSFVHALNLYGFRDDEWALEPPRAARRIAFVGDSFVEGFSTDGAGTLPRLFARLAADAGSRVETLNLGIGGARLDHYARLIRDAVPLFRPSSVILVLYANDPIPQRFDPAWLERPLQPRLSSPWTPRLVTVLAALAAGRRVPRRWIEPPFAYLPAVPDPRNPWSDGRWNGRLSAFVEPEVARAMRAGHFNWSLTEFLPWFGEHLTRRVELEPYLRALRDYVRRFEAELLVVYLPMKNQVSDRYLTFEAAYSPPGSLRSLLGEEFQVQARMLAATAARLDLAFLDLTPPLRALEASGPALYWSYDDHLRPLGYRAAAEQIFEAWRAAR